MSRSRLGTVRFSLPPRHRARHTVRRPGAERVTAPASRESAAPAPRAAVRRPGIAGITGSPPPRYRSSQPAAPAPRTGVLATSVRGPGAGRAPAGGRVPRLQGGEACTELQVACTPNRSVSQSISLSRKLESPRSRAETAESDINHGRGCLKRRRQVFRHNAR